MDIIRFGGHLGAAAKKKILVLDYIYVKQLMNLERDIMKSMDFKSLKERADADNFALLEKIIASLPRHSGFIAGGAIRRIITGEDLEKGDIDFFFRTPEDLEKYKQLLLTWKNVKFISSKDHVETFELTYGGKMSPVTFGHVEVKIEIQLIKIGYYPTAEDLLNSFDYTIAQFAIAPSQEIFYHGDFSLYDLGRKRIAV